MICTFQTKTKDHPIASDRRRRRSLQWCGTPQLRQLKQNVLLALNVSGTRSFATTRQPFSMSINQFGFPIPNCLHYPEAGHHFCIQLTRLQRGDRHQCVGGGRGGGGGGDNDNHHFAGRATMSYCYFFYFLFQSYPTEHQDISGEKKTDPHKKKKRL